MNKRSHESNKPEFDLSELYITSKNGVLANGRLFFSIEGNCGYNGMKDFLSENKLKDLLNGTDYVPTYEDKDGDWMLVGDVPWE